MTTYTREPAQQAAVRTQQLDGYTIAREEPSLVVMQRGNSVVIVQRNGTVKRGMGARR